MNADIQERMEEDVTAIKEINATEFEPTIIDDEEVTMTMDLTHLKMKAEKARILDEQLAKKLQDEEIEQAASREKQGKEYLERAKVLQQQYDQKPIFKREYNNVQTFLKSDRDEEPSKKRAAIETLLQESFKKLRAEVKVLVVEFKVEALQVKLVKERLSAAVPIVDKEKALWAELTRLYEPNADDVLWNLQRYMHYPIIWKLHSNCGVHQVSSTTRRYDIYMLAEKDYHLSNGVMTLMLSSKLQVEEDSEVARDLVMKIFIKANQPKSKSLDTSSKGIFLNQSKYALESLKKYGMESSDLVDTPMVEKSKLDEDPQGKAVDPTHYYGMVDTLMYLTDSSIALTAYADADHAGCQDIRGSTSEKRINTTAGNPVKEILLKLNLPDHKLILTDLKVTPTKHGRVTKPYSSLRFIAKCFISGIYKDGRGDDAASSNRGVGGALEHMSIKIGASYSLMTIDDDEDVVSLPRVFAAELSYTSCNISDL
nr:hypothetical protein [Tanacetum cinerariifolium]